MARCMYPFYVERKFYINQEERLTPVPCGKCPECLKRRTASWSHRLEMESLRWPKLFFITLTYDNEHIPITANNYMTLKPIHVTNYFKRLRKFSKFKYYYVGEYGTKFKRPHYHLILFGDDNLNEDILDSYWPYGAVYFGKVEPASIRYTIGYYNKGDWYPQHKRDDRHTEFSRMSKGLGKDFLTPKMVKHILDNPEKAYIYNSDGHKIALPRYYKRRLFDFVVSDKVVAENPAILSHIDDMLKLKKEHHEVIKAIMEAKETGKKPETKALVESRKMAIENFKRKHKNSRR